MTDGPDTDIEPYGSAPPSAEKAEHGEDVRGAWRELVRFLPDVGRLLWRLARDRRVPWTGKAVAGAALAYVASPLDFIPDFIPGAGQLDDVLIVARAIRFLFRSAGYELIQEHWDGTDEGFAALLVVAGIR